jgi:adenine-specific DNA-methyltransferase
VSTGPVVPFRAKSWLFELDGQADPHMAPFLWMQSVRRMEVSWPWNGLKKPQLISQQEAEGRPRLIPDQNLVLMRRFSAKEEHRRITAAPLLRGQLGASRIGLENHLNYIYGVANDLEETECIGLAAFLNSRVVDEYVRTTNGNTQISASEIRALPLPPKDALRQIGTIIGCATDDIDTAVAQALDLDS